MPFLLHSTPRYLKPGRISSALLPLRKKSLLSTGFSGFWPPTPPHSSACALGTGEGHLMHRFQRLPKPCQSFRLEIQLSALSAQHSTAACRVRGRGKRELPFAHRSEESLLTKGISKMQAQASAVGKSHSAGQAALKGDITPRAHSAHSCAISSARGAAPRHSRGSSAACQHSPSPGAAWCAAVGVHSRLPTSRLCLMHSSEARAGAQRHSEVGHRDR